jgi:hypothetical protein
MDFTTEVTENTESGGGKERRCMTANTAENITNIHELSIHLFGIIRTNRKALKTERLWGKKP